MAEAGERRSGITNTVTKMFSLSPQWLCKFDLWQEDVSTPIIEVRGERFIEVHILAQNRLFIDAFVVDSNLVVRHVVINHHLP